MTVRVYRHTDAGAPVLSGTAGALIALLDACLVNGYGSQAAAGWEKPFSGTNLAAYRAPSGLRHYLRIDDTGAGTVRGVGYEVMTDVNTGTGDFPTAAFIAGGLYILKSTSADTTARPWMVIATETRFYLWVGFNITTAVGYSTTSATQVVFFGEINSIKPGDAYHTLFVANAISGPTAPTFGGLSSGLGSTPGGHFFARGNAQTGVAVQASKLANVGRGAALNTAMGSSTLLPVYPDPVTGGFLMSPVILGDSGATRGILPGVWAPLHYLPMSPGMVFDGAGSTAGKKFIMMTVSNASTVGRAAFEISDTW